MEIIQLAFDFNNPVETKFWAKVDKVSSPHGCWLWTGNKPKGYGLFRVKGRTLMAHRFSWSLVHGPIPKGLNVCHDCPGGDNPSCVNHAHLWLGTPKENTQDMLRKGRAATGERSGPYLSRERRYGEGNSQARLTEAQVREIRQRYANGERQGDIARDYPVCKVTINVIVNRQRWKHLE